MATVTTDPYCTCCWDCCDGILGLSSTVTTTITGMNDVTCTLGGVECNSHFDGTYSLVGNGVGTWEAYAPAFSGGLPTYYTCASGEKIRIIVKMVCSGSPNKFYFTILILNEDSTHGNGANGTFYYASGTPDVLVCDPFYAEFTATADYCDGTTESFTIAVSL